MLDILNLTGNWDTQLSVITIFLLYKHLCVRSFSHSYFSARLVTDVDVPEENIATMLTYLELSTTRSWIKLKQPVNATCFIQCYGGAAHLTALAKQVFIFISSPSFQLH